MLVFFTSRVYHLPPTTCTNRAAALGCPPRRHRRRQPEFRARRDRLVADRLRQLALDQAAHGLLEAGPDRLGRERAEALERLPDPVPPLGRALARLPASQHVLHEQ